MGFFKKLLGPPSEGQLLLDRLRSATGMNLTPSHAGMFKSLKAANGMPEANDFGHAVNERSIRSLATTIDSWDGLDSPGEIMGRMISFMATIYDANGFRVEQLVNAMGETNASDRTETGDWTINMLGTAPHLGGRDNEQFSWRLADEIVRDPFIFARMVAWCAIGLARLSKTSKISAFESMRGWDVI